MEIIVIMLIAWAATKYGIGDAAAAIRGETPARWQRADARRQRRDTKREDRVPFMQRGAARRYASLVTQDAINDLAERHSRKRSEREARYEEDGEDFDETVEPDRLTLPERIASSIGQGVQRIKNRNNSGKRDTEDPVDAAFADTPREEVPTTEVSPSASSPADGDTSTVNEVIAPRLVPSDTQVREQLLDQLDPHSPETTIDAYERHLQWYLDHEPRTDAERISASQESAKALRTFRSEVHSHAESELKHEAHADRLAETSDEPSAPASATADAPLTDRQPGHHHADVSTWELIYADEETNNSHAKENNNMGAENSIEATSLVSSRNFAQGVGASANEAQVAVERNKAFMVSKDVEGEPVDLSAQLHEALGTVASLAESLDEALSKQTALREQYMANPDAGSKEYLMAG